MSEIEQRDHDDVQSIQYRPGTLADYRAAHRVFITAHYDLLNRQGRSKNPPTDADFDADWAHNRDLLAFLETHVEQFWVAEQAEDIIGFARVLRQEHVRELTEFFVLPDVQSRGVGRELLRRAFPLMDGIINAVISSGDARAHARYLKSGVNHQHLIYAMSRPPEPLPVDSDLTVTELTASPEHTDLVGRIDTEVLGFRRDGLHGWLRSNRQGFVYSAGGDVIGYGYVGEDSGPFALLDPSWYPQVLSHAEAVCARQKYAKIDICVPTPNRIALEHCLSRRFEIGRFIMYFMTSQHFGQFDRYIKSNPALVL